MRVIITCGPSWEPLDGARRLTNHSTGRLGAFLAAAFARAGWDVACLRGESATHPAPPPPCEVIPFAGNDDLLARLRELADGPRVDAVLHAAALCDYRVATVRDAAGRAVDSPKIATRDGRLHVELEPATKVLPLLRGLFPSARIVGWKYELAGTTADALARARRQFDAARVDACVLNGAAYGPGFGVCLPSGRVRHAADAGALAGALLPLAAGTAGPAAPIDAWFLAA